LGRAPALFDESVANAAGLESTLGHVCVFNDALVRSYQGDLEEFGLLDFKSESTGAGLPNTHS